MLIALVLSLLIMIAWNYVFPSKAQHQPPRQQKAIEQVYEQPPADNEPRFHFQPVSERVSSDVRAQAQDVEVKTPTLNATFSTLGGELKSLQLPEYDSKRGGKVELVPQDGDLQSPLSLQFHSPEFGTTAEDFVYDHLVYGPGDPALKQLGGDAIQIASSISPTASEDEVRHILEQQLPPMEDQKDLRSLVIGALSNEVPEGGASEAVANRAQGLEDSTILVFSHQMTPDLRLIKGFVFGPRQYSFVMHTVFRNTGDTPIATAEGRASYSVAWGPSLESPENTPKSDELYGVDMMGKNYTQTKIKKLKEEKQFSGDLKWIGLKRKYFFSALEPVNGLQSAQMEPLGEKKELVAINLNMDSLKIEPHDLAVDSIRISAGPMLKSVLDANGPGYNQILNFGFFDIFAKWLLAVLLWLNKAVQNYGLAIILLTIIVRLALFPLNQKSYRSMRSMQALQPKVNEIREKYKKNPQEMNKKMMELYRTNKVNPMGGCLPIAFQMPVFFALFQALRNAVELRGAHFLWMADLSEPDRLFTITQPFHFSLNLLPLLVIVAMLIQQKMTPMAATGQNQTQQKMMQYMPVFFGFLFYSMPSGLTVYFLVSTVLGLVQQYFVQKAA
jgi:YidC/Oxa1 family membrane protein insertase